ncbi:MAG: tail fiber domain-containing protein [Flavobacteriaceae bacterium]|nr:tail fiber domain-containing protein [Flavobacteriaceae bacterium]
MRKILLTLLLLPLAIYAQVGIGTTTPDSSSMLEVDATDKGVLIPRVAIADLNTAAPVTAPVESLLVYNTTVATGIGFHYWDGLKWTPLSGTAANDGDWTVVGNDMYNANSGYVGVGTTTPTAKLHIEDTSGSSIVAINDGFEDNTLAPCSTSGTGGNWSTTSAAGEFNTGTYGAGSGSGVDSSDSRLEITVTIPAGGSAYSFDYRVDSEGSYDYLRFYVDGVQEAGASWSGSVAWANYAGTLTAGTHTLSWRYSKDSSASSGLDRAFIDNISITATSTGQPVIRIVDGFEQAGRVLTSDASGNASWQDAGDDGDWITSGTNIYSANTGNVGVGTTTPIEKLHVVAQHILVEFDPDAVYSTKNTGTGKGYELIGTYQGWDSNAIYIGGYNTNHTGNNYDAADKVICGGNTAGNVGIGTLAITATAFNVSSSERFKKNITALEYGLDDLLKIKPVKYQYNFEKSGLYTIGFIAEEVSEVIPEIVSHQNENHKVVSREQGKPVSMDYSKMSAVLVNAVKEQYSKVQELKSNNEALEKRLARIEMVLLEKSKK